MEKKDGRTEVRRNQREEEEYRWVDEMKNNEVHLDIVSFCQSVPECVSKHGEIHLTASSQQSLGEIKQVGFKCFCTQKRNYFNWQMKIDIHK